MFPCNGPVSRRKGQIVKMQGCLYTADIALAA